MPVDHGGGVEPAVPVRGQLGAAPLGELGVPEDLGGLPDQWVVVDQHQRQLGVVFGEALLRQPDALAAPGVAVRVRVRVQEALVGADHAGLVRGGQRLLLGGGAGGPEGVVVQQEQRGDRDRAARAGPHRVGVLGGHHPEFAADAQQVLVALDAAQLDRVVGVGPQLVVAGCPDDLGEAFGEQAERPADGGGGLGHVTGHDQPVLGRAGAQLFHQVAVLLVGDVQVADREQPAPGPFVARAVRSVVTGHVSPPGGLPAVPVTVPGSGGRNTVLRPPTGDTALDRASCPRQLWGTPTPRGLS